VIEWDGDSCCCDAGIVCVRGGWWAGWGAGVQWGAGEEPRVGFGGCPHGSSGYSAVPVNSYFRVGAVELKQLSGRKSKPYFNPDDGPEGEIMHLL
jgi:hypothetical protein